MILPVLFLCFALRCCAAENEISVYPMVLQERTTTGSLVIRLTDEITLNLEKSSVLADKLLFVTSSKDGNQVNAVDTSAIQENLYSDSYHHSSLVVLQRNGTVQVEGVVNSKLRIKPVPQTERPMGGKILHSIYEVQEAKGGIDKIANFFSRLASVKHRRHVEKFVVEVHVVSDKEHQKHFPRDKDLIAYVAVMTSAVNSIYKDMTRPRISFKVAGITRNKDDAFVRKLYGTLDTRTLGGLVKYYKAGKIPGSPDAVYLLTSLGAYHDGEQGCSESDGYLMAPYLGGLNENRLSVCSKNQIRNTVQRLPDSCLRETSKTKHMVQHSEVPGKNLYEVYYCRKMLGENGRHGVVTVEKPTDLARECKMNCCTAEWCRKVDMLEGTFNRLDVTVCTSKRKSSIVFDFRSVYILDTESAHQKDAIIALAFMTGVDKQEMILPVLSLCLVLCCCAAENELSVYPTVLQERTTTGSLVIRLTDEITLNLEKSAVLADKLLVVTSNEDGNQVDAVETSAIQDNLYHDSHHRSSLMVRQRDGALEVEGVVNSRLRVKPLPQAERSLQGQILHSVYEVQEIKDDIVKMEPRLKSSYWRQWYPNWPPFFTRPTTQKPRTHVASFVVEVHVVSDKEHQKHFPKNEELIAYLAVMTNAVNLRYLDMRRPNITFKLVGITRNTDDVFAHEVYDTLEATQTLENLVKYYKGGNIPGNPDAVYLITGRDLSSIENGVLQKGVAGLAFLGRLCTKLAVAEGEDIAGSYSGVYPMAHELAHILGAEHDESPRCPWSAGYLMSYVDGGTNKYKLSVCSEEQIRRTVLKATDICLRETSKTNYMDQHRKFPGQKLSDVSYCRKMLKQYGGRHNVVTARKVSCSKQSTLPFLISRHI
ncbi:uncharacterized protein LOC144103773 [Amblyomma americanum]